MNSSSPSRTIVEPLSNHCRTMPFRFFLQHLLTAFAYLSLSQAAHNNLNAHEWSTYQPIHPRRRLAPPPQPVEQATGHKRVIFVRLDFPDWQTDASTTLSDSDISSWIGGTTDPNTQFRAFYELSSYNRLHLASPLIVHPAVLRAPAPSSSYSNVQQYWQGIKSLVETNTGPINVNTDLVIMVWQCLDHVQQYLSVPGMTPDNFNSDTKKNNAIAALASEMNVPSSRITIVHVGTSYMVYLVRVTVPDDSAALMATMNQIGTEATTPNTNIKTVLQNQIGVAINAMTTLNGKHVKEDCNSLSHINWAGQASPRTPNTPAMFALNGFSGCKSCHTGLLR